MTAGDCFQTARHAPGTPARFVHGNTVLPLPTTIVDIGFQLETASAFEEDERGIVTLSGRKAITKDYLFLFFCPTLSVVPAPERRSGFVAI